MRRSLVLFSFLVTLATTSAFAGRPADRDSLSVLDVANRALEGRSANVQLKDGELLGGVREVSLGADTTTWEAAGQTREVATAEIQRITVAKRSRIRRWARRGLIVGGLFGAVSGGYSEKDGFFVESPSASNVAAGALTGAAVGAAAGAVAGEKVVFDADAVLE